VYDMLVWARMCLLTVKTWKISSRKD
jgi:hypothetical protein